MKILYVTTVGDTMGFFRSLIKDLIEDGCDISIATNENGGRTPVSQEFREYKCQVNQISCSRNPFSLRNVKAVGEIRKLVLKNHYDAVHCHTPIAAACTRLACKSLRNKFGIKVIYTAHGFHFYTGAPIINWIIFYPVEWLCSFWTDLIITINKEDYVRAVKRFGARRIVYVPGVGVDFEKFKQQKSSREKIRQELGLSDNQIMILSVGELNENKNHEAAIKAIKRRDVVYVIVGKGMLKDKLMNLAKVCNVDLRLMGFREDVSNFYSAADIYVLPSIREGLNVSLMEAMASGLPIACGRIRGNIDIIDSQGGVFFDPQNIDSITNAIEKLIVSDRDQMGLHNINKIKKYDIESINSRMKSIYNSI